MTKLQQLQQELFNLKAKALKMLDEEGRTKEEFTEINNEIQTVKAKIKTVESAQPHQPTPNTGGELNPNLGGDLDVNAKYGEALFNALKGKATLEEITVLNEVRASLGSEVGADGGYLVPVDQQTEINELRRETSSLRELVTVEPVTTLSGSRVLEKDAEHTAFNAIGENTKIGDTNKPQFD
ncbi:MAG: phage major capsid protein, partial [Cetobacterium sp.]|uniref:phage major capsid protein n=1 Tax=Cetobacterium sp. TaxID=2071632 RepID=UPI003EE7CEDE